MFSPCAFAGKRVSRPPAAKARNFRRFLKHLRRKVKRRGGLSRTWKTLSQETLSNDPWLWTPSRLLCHQTERARHSGLDSISSGHASLSHYRSAKGRSAFFQDGAFERGHREPACQPNSRRSISAQMTWYVARCTCWIRGVWLPGASRSRSQCSAIAPPVPPPSPMVVR